MTDVAAAMKVVGSQLDLGILIIGLAIVSLLALIFSLTIWLYRGNDTLFELKDEEHDEEHARSFRLGNEAVHKTEIVAKAAADVKIETLQDIIGEHIDVRELLAAYIGDDALQLRHTSHFFQTELSLKFILDQLKVNLKRQPKFKSVVASNAAIFLLSEHGQVYSCGCTSGHSLKDVSLIPKQIDALAHVRIKSIEYSPSGNTYILFLTESGEAYSHGDGRHCGHGERGDIIEPKKIDALSGKNIKSIIPGHHYTEFLSQTGDVYYCGYLDYGLAGDIGDQKEQLIPKRVDALLGKNITSIAKKCHTLINGEHREYREYTSASGKVYSCREGQYDKIMEIDNVEIKRASAVYKHQEPLSRSGQYCSRVGMYKNHYGDPIRIEGISDIEINEQSNGHRHTVLLSQSGKVYTHGKSIWGALGHGDSTVVPILKQITEFAPSKKTMALIKYLEKEIKEESVNTTQEPGSSKGHHFT